MRGGPFWVARLVQRAARSGRSAHQQPFAKENLKMATEVEKQKSESKAVVLTKEREQALNNATAYGKRESTSTVIIGEQLKFVKGDWLLGKDGDSLPLGTKLVFNLDSATNGWQRWDDGRVTDADMGAIVEGFQPKPREMLSTPNRADWPEDENGYKKDPWARSFIALMKEPGKKGRVFTLTVGSKGGISATGELMKKTGEGMRERGEMYPVVTLGASTYYNKKFKTDVDVPVFKIVGWVPVSDFDVPLVAKADQESDESDAYEAEAEAETKVKKAPEKKPARKAAKSKPMSQAGKGRNGKAGREISYE
jgi:hypothetical protein